MQKIKFWIPPFFWAVLIFTLSSIQVGSTSEFYWKDFLVKKTAHLIEYFIFSLLIYRAFINTGTLKNKAILYSFSLAVFYAMTDEYHQSFTPGRGPAVRDVIIDAFGSGLAVFGLIGKLDKMPKKVKIILGRIKII